MEAPFLLSIFLYSIYFIYGGTSLIIKFSMSIYYIYGVTFLINKFSIFNLFYLWTYLPYYQVFYILSILFMELPSLLSSFLSIQSMEFTSLLLSFLYSTYFIYGVIFLIIKFSIFYPLLSMVLTSLPLSFLYSIF